MGSHAANIDLPADQIPSGELLLERFEIVRKLGASTFCSIYLVKDLERNGKQFALKLLTQEFLDHLQANQSIRNEILNSKKIETSHVVKVIEPVCGSDQIGVLLQYAGNRTFKSIIEDSSDVSIEKMVSLLIQGCSGLSAVHAAGLVHRDLKPANFLIGDDGIVRLGGLGLSKPIEQLKTAEHDQVQGNVGYASPEFLTDGRLDRRSDIYALGLIAYELIARRFPFSGETPLEVVKKRLTSDAPALNSLVPTCPAGLSEIIDRAMSRDPDKRFESVLEFELALRDTLTTFSKPEETVVSVASRDDSSNGVIKERLNAIRSGKIIYATTAFGEASSFTQGKNATDKELAILETATFDAQKPKFSAQNNYLNQAINKLSLIRDRRVQLGLGALTLLVACFAFFSESSIETPSEKIVIQKGNGVSTPQFSPKSKEESRLDQLLRKGVAVPAAPSSEMSPKSSAEAVESTTTKPDVPKEELVQAPTQLGESEVVSNKAVTSPNKAADSALKPRSNPPVKAKPVLSPELQKMKEEAEAIRSKMYGPFLPDRML